MKTPKLARPYVITFRQFSGLPPKYFTLPSTDSWWTGDINDATTFRAHSDAHAVINEFGLTAVPGVSTHKIK